MQPNTLRRREYKGKIYVKNIRKNSCRIQDTDPKPTEMYYLDKDSKKIILDPQHCINDRFISGNILEFFVFSQKYRSG